MIKIHFYQFDNIWNKCISPVVISPSTPAIDLTFSIYFIFLITLRIVQVQSEKQSTKNKANYAKYDKNRNEKCVLNCNRFLVLLRLFFPFITWLHLFKSTHYYKSQLASLTNRIKSKWFDVKFSFMCMFCRSFLWFVLFLLTIVLSVLLRFTDFDYPFGIFKLFYWVKNELSHR